MLLVNAPTVNNKLTLHIKFILRYSVYVEVLFMLNYLSFNSNVYDDDV